MKHKGYGLGLVGLDLGLAALNLQLYSELDSFRPGALVRLDNDIILSLPETQVI